MIWIGILIGYVLGFFASFFILETKKVKVNRNVMEVTENVFSPKLGKRITNNVN
jgi:hypothetical protein